jgi:hypothetical protein
MPPSRRRRQSRRQTRRKTRKGGAKKLVFDKTLETWPIIQGMFQGKTHVIVGFTDKPVSKMDTDIINSEDTMEWIYNNFYTLLGDYCNDEIDSYYAKHRFVSENYEYGNNGNNNYNIYVTFNSIPFMLLNTEGTIEAFMFVSDYDTSNVHIDDICVGDKKKGYGKLLITHILNKLKANLEKTKEILLLKNPTKKNHINNLHITVNLTSVESAVDFYKKMGFVLESEDELTMKLVI